MFSYAKKPFKKLSREEILERQRKREAERLAKIKKVRAKANEFVEDLEKRNPNMPTAEKTPYGRLLQKRTCARLVEKKCYAFGGGRNVSAVL